MKVVINRDTSYFNMVDEAWEKLLELGMKVSDCDKKGSPIDPSADIVRYSERIGGSHYSFMTNKPDLKLRTDNRLIQAVEEMGALIDTEWTKIAIVEVPDGIDVEIELKDSGEKVVEKHREWG